MMRKTLDVLFCGAMLTATCALSAETDVQEGEQLFARECRICHGDGKQAQEHGAIRPSAHLSFALADRPPSSDAAPAWLAKPANSAAAGRSDDIPDRLAFAPPFGPNLQGVYGRPAGTAPGYEYSKTFLAALKEVVWDEASLNVWITNPQKWVPGVYMYYKQKDPEVRRKIIAYLKSVATK